MTFACTMCGACCVGPDISTLNKPLGVPCAHLGTDHRCTIYDERPQVCRDYQADELCTLIAADTLEERAEKLLAIFGLTPGG
jgi:Fe-S-cluster containining protein